MIQRLITEDIKANLGRKKVITILGPRQVGKTTLLDQLSNGLDAKILTLNCDDVDDAELLQGRTTTELKQMLSGYDVAFIDEIQRVEDVGLVLKKIADLKLNTKVVVTGSSSLNLRDKTAEPATGRLLEYELFPFAISELSAESSWHIESRLLESRMIYGLYPDVVNNPADAKRTLMALTNSYLYKDLLAYDGIRKPQIIQKLVKALALQVGSEVSYNELAQLVGVDKATVENYIDILEKCFVVFKLDSFSRNLRNEIKKGKKIYFYDNGIRNAVISNFAPLDSRTDVGALWENLMVSERKKANSYNLRYATPYFWRTHEQKEIDYVEEVDGRLHAYEFKFNPRATAKIPTQFSSNYPEATFEIITPTNYQSFIS